MKSFSFPHYIISSTNAAHSEKMFVFLQTLLLGFDITITDGYTILPYTIHADYHTKFFFFSSQSEWRILNEFHDQFFSFRRQYSTIERKRIYVFQVLFSDIQNSDWECGNTHEICIEKRAITYNVNWICKLNQKIRKLSQFQKRCIATVHQSVAANPRRRFR